jgi:hypothetical protein
MTGNSLRRIHMALTRRRRTRRPANPGQVQRTIAVAIVSGATFSAGVVTLVRNTLVAAMSGARGIGAEIGRAGIAAVRGSIRAAYDIGGDLGLVTKGSMKGTLHAADQLGSDIGEMARSAARGAVKAASDLGADVALVARRAVEGSAEAARELGRDPLSIARSAAEGAVEAADRIGGATASAVRRALEGTVAGARGLLVSVTKLTAKSTKTARIVPSRGMTHRSRETSAGRRKSRGRAPRA